jgi:hypothetical protein
MVKIIRTGTTTEGENIKDVFTVNRLRILNALKWLKQHNLLYQDIIIKESNLNWMSNQKSDILQKIIQINTDSNEDEEKDDGPCYDQVLQPQEDVSNPENEITVVYLKTRHKLCTMAIRAYQIEERIKNKTSETAFRVF